MASLLLAQLVHTSFPVVGFKTVASKEVPDEIQKAFIENIVYQYWDSYNPPSAGYRAAYLYQVNSEQSLFGWLYNDGLDDFGRSDVPYFICYYLTGKIHPLQLENIFICLCTGPISLMNRQHKPGSLQTLAIPDLWSYQPARMGVKIPQEIVEKSEIDLLNKQLLNLFVFTVEEKIQDSSISDRNLLLATTTVQPVIEKLPDVAPLSVSDPPVAITSAADYQQILLTQTRLKNIQKAGINPAVNVNLIRGIILSNIVLLAMISFGYYVWKLKPINAPSTTNRNSIPKSNLNLQSKKLNLTQTLIGHRDAVWSVLLTRNGETLVSASADKTIKVWNLKTRKVMRTLVGHTDTIRAIALNQNEQVLVSGGADQKIKIWNFQTFDLMSTLSTNAGSVWSVAISNDGQLLISGSEDGSIKIWNLYTGKIIKTIHGHQGRVYSVAISPDQKTFATGGLDSTIKIWDLSTGKMLRAIAQHQSAVRSVIFSPDGKILASASWDETIKIWRVDNGQLLHNLMGHTARVVTLSWGFDQQTLISGSIDNTIKVWNIQTGKLIDTLASHADWILAIATNPTQKILVSSSKDQTIRIWQPKN